MNDIEMLKFAGLGVAVGNATQAARDAADEYVHNDDHEGVARTLRRLFQLASWPDQGSNVRDGHGVSNLGERLRCFSCC